MDQRAPYERLFRATSVVTDHFPRAGARLLDTAVGGSLGNPLLLAARLALARRQAAHARTPDRILVIADMNIGDAVILQGAITGLRDFFPSAEIDYVISRVARNLVEGNPEITVVWPLFEGPHPTPADHAGVARIARNGAYDLVLSFCPFFNCRTLCSEHPAVVDYGALATQLVHSERHGGCAHVVYGAHQFIHTLLSPLHTVARPRPFTGVTVTLSDEAVDAAAGFMTRRVHRVDRPVVLYNPDASSTYTRLPFAVQTMLLRRLLALDLSVVLGAGHAEPGLERRLLDALTPAERRGISVLPASVPLDAYAAVVDMADAFITADTGPLHVGAARKVSRSGRHTFRNRTAVLALFGATSPKLYGYDSDRPGFFAANQDAPSRSYVAASPCRNLTCINKAAKACREVRCFEGFDPDDALRDVVAWLDECSSTTCA